MPISGESGGGVNSASSILCSRLLVILKSPLWRAPNLFITPHTSAVSDRLWHRETALLMDLLERWFDGREMFNQVDFARGY